VTISGGALVVDALTAQHTNRVTVGSEGRLELSGELSTVNGTYVSGVLTGAGDAHGSLVTIENGGKIEPGLAGIGTLTTGSLTLNEGSSYNWQIADPYGEAGSSWDLISVMGGVSIGRSVTLNVIGLGDAPSVANGSSISWAIANYSGLLSFSGSDLNSRFIINPTGTWDGLDSNYRFSITSDANTLYLTMAVPEPKDYAMILGVITLGLVGYRRWRRPAQVA
jgi:hypothetical protein